MKNSLTNKKKLNQTCTGNCFFADNSAKCEVCGLGYKDSFPIYQRSSVNNPSSCERDKLASK